MGHIEDIIRGDRHTQDNTFGIHVSFDLTLLEAEAYTKGKAISCTRCYLPNLKDTLKAISECNDKVLKYLESFAKECGCDFKPYGNGLAIDHYVKHYPQAA